MASSGVSLKMKFSLVEKLRGECICQNVLREVIYYTTVSALLK